MSTHRCFMTLRDDLNMLLENSEIGLDDKSLEKTKKNIAEIIFILKSKYINIFIYFHGS